MTDRTGRPLRGVMDAQSEAEVHQRLLARGYYVRSVTPTGAPTGQPQPRYQAMPRLDVPTYRTTVSASEMAVLFRGLAQYLQAGVAVHQALVEISSKSPKAGTRFIGERLASRVQAGEPLSAAMAQFPRAFPPHVIGVIHAGELGGFLPLVVGDVALDYEISQRASSRGIRFFVWVLWINALAQLPLAPIPLMMFRPGVDDIVGGIMQGVVLSVKYVIVPMIFAIAAYFTVAWALRQPNMRPLASGLLLRVPWAGRASRERSLASFSRILWRLQNAGILPIHAWDAASRSAENVVIASRLHEQLGAVKAGRKFSDAIAATGIFRGDDARVLAVGETTGQAVDSLQRIAAFYEDAALYSVGRARWLGVHIGIIANLLSLGVVAICIAKIYPNMFKWVDWYFAP